MADYELNGRIGLDIKPLAAGLAQALGQMREFSAEANLLGGIIASGFTVAAVAGVAKYTLELGKVGAEHKRLDDSFRQLAKSPDALIARLKEASGETISTNNLILSSNRAMMLGLGSDADKLGQLMEVARFRGRAMGSTTAQAFSDIVTGVGRMSPLILDNLGIMVDADATYQSYADSVGKTATALTGAEKRQALMNRVIDEGERQIAAAGGVTDDAADAFERYGAKVDDLKATVAELAIEPATVVVNLMTKSAQGWINTLDAIDIISRWEKDHPGQTPLNPINPNPFLMNYGAITPASRQATGPLATIERYAGGETSPYQKLYDTLNQAYRQKMIDDATKLQEQRYARTARSIMDDVQTIGDISADVMYRLTYRLDAAALRWQAMGYAAVEAHRRAQQAIWGSDQAIEHQIGLLEQEKSLLSDLFNTGGWLALSSAAPGQGYGFMESVTNQDTIKKTNDFLDQKRAEQVRKDEAATAQYWSDWKSKAQEALNALEGFAQGAFTSVPDDIRAGLVGTDMQLGNAWDERARRALDVGNLGAKSPWAGEFTGWQGMNDEQRQAWGQYQAWDIRQNPSIEKIGPEGMAALEQTALQNIQAEVDKQALYKRVEQALVNNPEAVANMKALGIDVKDAFAEPSDKIVDHMDSGVKKLVEAVRSIGGGGDGGGGNNTATGSDSGWGDYGKTITGEPRSRLYAAGGEVEGSGNRPVPVIAHEGEWILNQLQQEQLKAMLAARTNGPTYNITGPLTVRSDNVSGIMQELADVMPTSL